MAEDPVVYTEVLLFLAGAVIAPPFFKWLGLGTVIGYLVAGVAIGPIARLVVGSEEILHVGELGVVFLLFIIGLELKPKQLWSMRREIFGLGLAQIALTGVVLAALAMAFAGQDFAAATIIGFGLAMSSTACVMQILEERHEMNRPHGQTSFAILLFQDIAIAPLLALVPLLAEGTERAPAIGEGQFLLAAGIIAVLVLSGRFLLNPVFRLIAGTGAKEAMIAAALLVVMGAATMAQVAGLSMALGAFIAGVMLAESSFRHELQANIEPFRGVLLGLFFMAIGLSLDLAVLRANWLGLAVAVPIFMAAKALIVYSLCRLFRVPHNDAVKVAMLLPQGGEFAFVLFTAAAGAAIFPAETASMLIAVVTLTMALTPLSVRLGGLFARAEKPDTMEEDFDGAGADVLMIGFSRFGQIASQILLSGGSEVTIIDHSARRVRAVEKFGFRIYYGDGRRKEVLEAAGIREAKLVAVCTHGRETTDTIVALIQSEYPDVKLYVRSYDRTHTLDLRARGVDYEIRETLESALMFGRRTLEALGAGEEQAYDIAEDVRRRDEERLAIQAAEGFNAGIEKMRPGPMSPEPLVKPSRAGRRLNREAESAEEKAS